MGDEAPLKAKLKCTLKADDVVVAEVEIQRCGTMSTSDSDGTNAWELRCRRRSRPLPPPNPSDALES